MPTFDEWSNQWEDGRNDPNPDAVLKLWKGQMPSGWQQIKRSSWPGKLGYRHNHKDGGGPRGEQKIEKLLLDGFLHEVVNGTEHLPFLAVYQKMALANQRRNQRIADALGLLLHRGVVHPVMVEVKENANNCWYALVECLQQVKMGNANAANIVAFLDKWKLPYSNGVWGLVLAPSRYLERDDTMECCKALLALLGKRTNARVALASTDNLRNHSISVKVSNWS
jgi:hypothetical protein